MVWRLFRNVNFEHEWALYKHIIYIAFCVLVLKVVAIYLEPSLIIILKES
jgi:ABC-type polysaccharide/polyol phosphate export permease